MVWLQLSKCTSACVVALVGFLDNLNIQCFQNLTLKGVDQLGHQIVRNGKTDDPANLCNNKIATTAQNGIVVT